MPRAKAKESWVSCLESSGFSSHGASNDHSLSMVSMPLHFCFNSSYDFTYLFILFLSSLKINIYNMKKTQYCEKFQLHFVLWVLNANDNMTWFLLININFSKLNTVAFYQCPLCFCWISQLVYKPENSVIHILHWQNQCILKVNRI